MSILWLAFFPKAKSTPLPPASLQQSANRLIERARQYPPPENHDPFLDFWFKRAAQDSLSQLRQAIDDVRHPLYKRFFLVTLSSIVRSCSYADPAIPPPVRLSPRRAPLANARYRRHLALAQALTSQTVYDHFHSALDSNIRRVARLNHCINLGPVSVLGSMAEAAATTLSSHSVDVILTSPPYCGAQKYARSLQLELRWLGFSREQIARVDRKTLGTERITKAQDVMQLLRGEVHQDTLIRDVWDLNPVRATMLSSYLAYIDRFSSESRRVLRPGGDMFVSFGTSTIAGVSVDLAAIFKRLAVANGLRYVTTLVDTIPSRGLLTQRHRSAATILDEQVVWLRG